MRLQRLMIELFSTRAMLFLSCPSNGVVKVLPSSNRSGSAFLEVSKSCQRGTVSS